MAARAATSALRGRLPTLRRVCSLFSVSPNLSVQSTNCSLVDRTIEPGAQLILKREAEAEKALQTGDAFVQHRVFGNLHDSTVKEVDLSHNDKPIFFGKYAIRGARCYSALSLEDDGKLSKKYDIYPPFPPNKLYGCSNICDGIFCFFDSNSTILLWNPTTNESKILPQSQSLDGVTKNMYDCGIWVDDKSQDYKVMRVFSCHFETEPELLPNLYLEIELYSLKTDSWKKISCAEFTFCAPPSACINGVQYINAHREDESNEVILTFDFSTETLSYLPLPDIEEMTPYYILEYKGLLSILSGSSYRPEAVYEHWVMRNGSWCRLSVFHTRNVGPPLGFSRNGELLFFKSSNDHPLVFDSATGKLKHLHGCGTGELLFFKSLNNLPLVFDCATGKLKHLHGCGTGELLLFPFSESFVKLKGGLNLEEREKEEDGRMIEANHCQLMV